MSKTTNAAWSMYAADFNALSDEEIEYESNACRNQLEEAESWLEAVAAWEAAGKPRSPEIARLTNEGGGE